MAGTERLGVGRTMRLLTLCFDRRRAIAGSKTRGCYPQYDRIITLALSYIQEKVRESW